MTFQRPLFSAWILSLALPSQVIVMALCSNSCASSLCVFVSAEAAAEALHSAKKAFQRALFMQPQRHQAWTNLGYTCLTQVGEGTAERRHASLCLPFPSLFFFREVFCWFTVIYIFSKFMRAYLGRGYNIIYMHTLCYVCNRGLNVFHSYYYVPNQRIFHIFLIAPHSSSVRR